MAEATQQQRVNNAFSRQSVVFDVLDEEPLIQWVRERVREATLTFLCPGDHILEINAGTGIDTFWFAEHGMHVLATDAAPGMVAELRRKHQQRSELPVRVEQCSFLELASLAEAPFDAAFSNFGGLNCTDRLDAALHGVDARLRPGGICALVIMPRFSPWELVDVCRGKFNHALRRYRSGGTLARVEGVTFQCYYHDAHRVRLALPGYEVVHRSALSFFVPPPHLGPFAQRHPKLVVYLKKLERAMATWPFIRSRGDHYLIILRKPSLQRVP